MGSPLKLAFGEVEIDEARFELRRLGRPVTLQPKALELVLYLARHRERVVTKDELLREVWKGAVVTDASLSQALSLARRALDDSAELQRVIRTVRGRGLQFIAHERSASTRPPKRDGAGDGARRAPPRDLVSTGMETAQDARRTSPVGGDVPHLFAVIHCDAPAHGGACWSLGDVDEVEIGRGTVRRSELRGQVTRLLAIAVPGRQLSRTHARLTRTPDGWVLVDADSRNGTYVGGRKVKKHALADGDIVECGRTMFRFAIEPRVADSPGSAHEAEPESVVQTLSPRLRPVDRELGRIAASDVPVMLVGESGVGKTRAAHAVHAFSSRHGALVEIDARALPRELLTDPSGSETLANARGGTLVIKHVEALNEADAASLACALDTADDVRLVSTSLVAAPEGAERAVTDLWQRLAGYRAALPPLRERLGDFGLWVSELLADVEPKPALDVAAALALLRYPWPGNVRELSHKLKAAITLADGALVGLEHLPPEVRDARAPVR